MKDPIKRNKFLQPLSRDHHHGLLLCWKIRTGFKKSIDCKRIKAYSDWFYLNYLLEHFKQEEEIIFPILGFDHPHIKKAITDHRRLKRLFEDTEDVEKSQSLIEEELEQHIRFEERILFKEIQNTVDASELDKLERLHESSPSLNNWKDEFWI